MGLTDHANPRWLDTMRARLRNDAARLRIGAAVDQAIFSGTNFVLTVLVALSGNMSELGTYALVSSAATLLLGVAQSMSVDPMTVFFAGDAHSGARRVVESILNACCIIVIVVSVGYLTIVGWSAKSIGHVIALGVALAAMQIVVLARKRTYYIEGQVRGAVRVSAMYMLGALGGATIAFVCGRAPNTIFVAGCVLIGFLVSSGAWSIRAASAWRSRDALPKGWHEYSASSLLVSIASSIGLQGFYWIGVRTAGLEVVGSVKVVEQMMMPLVFTLTMLSLPDLVESSQDFSNGRIASIRHRCRRRSSQFSLVAAVYVAFLIMAVWVASSLWRSHSHGGAPAVVAVLVFGACVVIQAISVPRLTSLRAIRSPKWILCGYMCMAAGVMTAGATIRPTTVVGVVALLTVGWLSNLFVLEYGTRRSLN